MQGHVLKKLVKEAGYRQEDFADMIGVSRNYLLTLFDKAIVKEKYLQKACEILNVSMDIFTKENNVINIFKGKEKNEESKPVPYYDIDATAGNITIFSEDGVEYIKQHISVPQFSDCDMFINVSGDSMYPKYCSGELIALKRLKDFEVIAYNEAYLIVTDEQRLLKRICKSDKKDMWLLCSDNKDYEPFDIHIKKIRFLYIVKGKITKNII